MKQTTAKTPFFAMVKTPFLNEHDSIVKERPEDITLTFIDLKLSKKRQTPIEVILFIFLVIIKKKLNSEVPTMYFC
jgi:hypothetical protein